MSMQGSQIFSHPNRLLKEHLENVYKGIEHIGIDDNIAFVLGMFHDAAKATKDFQQYLAGGKKKAINHAFPSALFALNYLLNTDNDIKNNKDTLMAILFAIAWHHTGFKSQPRNMSWDREIDIVNKHYEEIRQFYQSLNINIPPLQIDRLFEVYVSFVYDNMLEQEDNVLEKIFFLTRYFLSSLVASDRIDAISGNVKEHYTLLIPTLDISQVNQWISAIERFIQNAPQTQVNLWRTDILNRTLQFIKNNSEAVFDENLLSLPIPTGGGKTLTSFRVALELLKTGKWKRIIYVLPFVNLGNQTYEVFTKQLGIDKQYIMLDNYLASSNVEVHEENMEINTIFEISRYWHKPIIITTSVHMWEILFGKSNSDIMNYHLLTDAIVIWDEVQSIPTKFWGDMEYVLKYLANELNTFSIVMSATQPLQITDNQIIEPLPDFLNRYEVHYIKERKYQQFTDEQETEDYGQLLSSLLNCVDTHINSGKQIAIITNTKNQSKHLFRTLKDRYNIPILLLNTNFIPKHRDMILEKVNEYLINKQPFLLVSTQVIEAGADLDFDVIIRYLAPIDSMIQAAGRVNRHGKKKGLFIIYDNPNPGFNERISNVYGKIKSDILRNDEIQLALQEVTDEKTLNKLANKYFTLLRNRTDIFTIFPNIRKQQYHNKDWHLIAYKHTISVIINWHDEVEATIIPKLLQLDSQLLSDKYTKVYKKRILYNRLYAYILNIFYNKNQNNLSLYEILPTTQSIYYVRDWKAVYSDEEGWLGVDEWYDGNVI